MSVGDSASDGREQRLTEANLRLRREVEEARTRAEDAESKLEGTVSDLEEANRALDRKAEILAQMSHELRTPMNGILGMTQLALQSELSEKQREYLEVVRTSADALLTLVNDILDLSKLDAGMLTLETIPFNLGDTVANTVRSVSLLAEEKGVEVKVSLAEGMPLNVVGDPGRLRQVLLNLVGNAIKFTDEGEIWVRVEKLWQDPEGLRLGFRVEDSGIGIPSHRITSIFEPYEQASDSTSRQRGGTGLGLAICKTLVELMGGEIAVESQVGVGSTFSFDVHLFMPQEQQTMLADVDVIAGSNVFVLAAERPAYALAEMLEGAQTDTSVFTTVDAATSAAEVSTPSVVIIDLDQHSLATVSKFPGAHTVVVSSSGQRGDAARCRELGVSAYLTRPLGPLDLRDAIRGSFAAPEGTLITRHWLREQRPSLNVLVVDDSDANRMVVGQMLSVQDHKVEAVTNGLEALEAVKRAKFDLILMDMEMPEMDGLTAAKTIRLWEGKVRTPIVALTGHSSREMVQKAYDAGMDAHLAKPFEFVELADVIERLMDDPVADAAA